jgi:hypothetical protein
MTRVRDSTPQRVKLHDIQSGQDPACFRFRQDLLVVISLAMGGVSLFVGVPNVIDQHRGSRKEYSNYLSITTYLDSPSPPTRLYGL